MRLEQPGGEDWRRLGEAGRLEVAGRRLEGVAVSKQGARVLRLMHKYFQDTSNEFDSVSPSWHVH